AERAAGRPTCLSALRTATSVGLRVFGLASASASEPRTPWLAMADDRSFASTTEIPCGIDSVISRRTTSASAPSTRMATPCLPDAPNAMLATKRQASAMSQVRVILFIFVQGLVPTADTSTPQYAYHRCLAVSFPAQIIGSQRQLR